MGVLANLQAKVVKLADKTLCTCNSVIIATNFTKLSLVKNKNEDNSVLLLEVLLSWFKNIYALLCVLSSDESLFM